MVYLRYIEAAALIAVVLVFACRGLLKYYPAFMLFLIAKGTRSLCLISLDYHDPLYGKCWAFSAPILMTLQILVVLELTGKIVEHYPKIDKKGAKLIVGSCLGIGAAVGSILSIVQFGNGQCPWYVAGAVGACKFVDWISVGALGFVSVWVAAFPEPIRRNVQWHRWLLASYIGFAPGIALMFSTVGKSQRFMVDAANWGLEITEIACCVFWCVALNQSGEVFPYVPKTISDEQLALIDRDYQEAFNVLRTEFPLPEIIPKD
ncbi:MAG: hypothetical protein WB992_02440 [Bryobacteraceae bacterium]